MAEVAAGIAAGILAVIGGMEPAAALILGILVSVVLVRVRQVQREIESLRARVAHAESRLDGGEEVGAVRVEAPIGSSTPAVETAAAPSPVGPPIAPPPIAGWRPPSAPAPAPVAWPAAPSTAAAAAPPVASAVAPLPVAPAAPSWLDEAIAGIARAVGPRGSSRDEIEAWIGGRLLAIVGGVALVLGALFFLSLAFSRGWIGPELRVVIGYLAGSLLLGGAIWLLDRRFVLLGHVLVAVGLAVISLATFAATRLFGLMPTELGLAISLVVAVVTAWVALRADSQAVALLGVAALLGAPPILDAPPESLTLVYVAASLVGATVLSLRKGWPWLPVLAFALTVPQMASYVLSEPQLTLGILAISGFAALIALAAYGSAVAARERLTLWASVGLLVANAAFLLAFAAALIGTDEPLALGAYLALAAAAHLALASWSFVRRGDDDVLGIATAGVGVCGLAIALPVAFEGPMVAIGWAAMAVLLAVLAHLREHLAAAVGAAILGGMAALHVVVVEYAPASPWITGDLPFIDMAGLALAGVLVAAAVVIVAVPRQWLRSTLCAAAAGLVAYGCWYELGYMAILSAWATLAAVAIVVQARLLPPPAGSIFASPFIALGWALTATAATLGGLAVIQYVVAFAGLRQFTDGLIGRVPPPAVPFTDEPTIGAVILVVLSLTAAFGVGLPIAILAGAAFAAGVVAYLMPFELAPWLIAIAWSGIGLVGIAAAKRDEVGRSVFVIEGGIVLGLATFVAIAVVAPPDRLGVDAATTLQHPLLVSEATAALGACALALASAAWIWRGEPAAMYVGLGAAAVGVYLLSIGVVDHFQGQVGTGPFTVEELQKQAQVALSVLWLTIGAIAFAVGLLRGHPVARLAGLALLGLATVKVFAFDLAFLDVAYRVLSFVALGLLLLLSAFAYQRLRPRMAATAGE